jgi:hypothetical protein
MFVLFNTAIKFIGLQYYRNLCQKSAPYPNTIKYIGLNGFAVSGCCKAAFPESSGVDIVEVLF